jgi:hypothetical protein
MSTTGRELEPEMSVVPLQNAVFCVNCETISNSPHDVCEVCGSRSLVSLFRMLGGTLHGDNQTEELVKYNLDLTIRVHELSAADLNRAINALTRLAEVGKDLQALHMNVESVLVPRREHVLEVAA